MSDDELRATATLYAEHGQPLPGNIISSLTPNQLTLAAGIFQEAGRRHHAEVDELEQLLQARRRSQ